MIRLTFTRLRLAIPTILALAACSGTPEGEGDQDSTPSSGPAQVVSDDGAEESGTTLTLEQTYDAVRKGVRLTMSYNATLNAFEGKLENTSTETSRQVRVEVHLSNGTELGPTESGDLAPGATHTVSLSSESNEFDGWSAHAESGTDEHGGAEGGSEGREGDGEHGRRESGEHERRERGEHESREGGEEHR